MGPPVVAVVQVPRLRKLTKPQIVYSRDQEGVCFSLFACHYVLRLFCVSSTGV